MKVLYGVQATGNGHITRARVMAPALQQAGVDVDFLFSGREPGKLFNMEPFGDYRCRRGLTFYMDGSRVDQWKTVTRNAPFRLLRDIFSLDLSSYDLVITDFEPVSAWAAKLQGVPSVGIAHQYAFLHPLPDSKSDFLLRNQVRLFAPATKMLGLHWHHFDKQIFPPLIQAPLFEVSEIENKIVVYLPHDDLEKIGHALSIYPDYDFYIYAAVSEPQELGNLHIRPFCREGFHRDLASCHGVICNSGFGLLSEAMQYGKKILSLPQKGQAEQESNAELLSYLGLGIVVESLDSEQLATWLELPAVEKQSFPDLATLLAEWIASGCETKVDELVATVWDDSKKTAEPSLQLQ